MIKHEFNDQAKVLTLYIYEVKEQIQLEHSGKAFLLNAISSVYKSHSISLHHRLSDIIVMLIIPGTVYITYNVPSM